MDEGRTESTPADVPIEGDIARAPHHGAWREYVQEPTPVRRPLLCRNEHFPASTIRVLLARAETWDRLPRSAPPHLLHCFSV